MSNDFKTFAADPGANVLSQAQYDLLTTLRAQGFLAGTAESIQLNKVWRQSSIMAAVLGSLIESVTGQNAVDDGTTTTLLKNLFTAVLKAGYVADSGVVNAYAITLSPAPLAYYDGMVVGFSTANANTSATPTLNVNGLGAIGIKQVGGANLTIGHIQAGAYNELVYRSVGPRFELLSGKFALADGSNASGTWPIGISGVAASAATATNQSGGTINATGGTVDSIPLTRGGVYKHNTNVGVGIDALLSNSNVGAAYGLRNTAFGNEALKSETAAQESTAVGYRALAEYTAGTANGMNTAVGSQALAALQTGWWNVAVGKDCLVSTVSGTHNTGVGVSSLWQLTTGTYNVAVGFYAGSGVTTGSSNVGIGPYAGSGGAGSNNVGVGGFTFYNLSTGDSNTALGTDASYGAFGAGALTNGSNNMLLGYRATPSAATMDNEITLGNSAIVRLRCNVTSLTALSDARDKKEIVDLPIGLGFINTLRPVKFTWDARDGGRVGDQDCGFIAQELKQSQDNAGATEYAQLVLEANPERLEATQGRLIPIMVKAMQELSAKFDRLEVEFEQYRIEHP